MFTEPIEIAGVAYHAKDKFKCLYLLVETAMVVRQREKDIEDDIHVLGDWGKLLKYHYFAFTYILHK